MTHDQELRVHDVEIYRLQVAMKISLVARQMEAEALVRLEKEKPSELAIHLDSACTPKEHAESLLLDKI